MVSIEAGGFVAVALAVFVPWRFACWRGAGGDPAREVAVAALFTYLVTVACIAFFPVHIIFYDWHGRFSLMPLASITDLLLHTTPATALVNIVGNVAMFVPMGVLLPLLFRKLRSARSLLWRVTLISAAIEVLQMPTRVRATDVDDVILNVAGAAIGFVAFVLVSRIPALAALLDRMGSSSASEPLRAGLVPVTATVVLSLGLIVPPVFANTLDEDAIRRDAMAGLPDASVVASTHGQGYAVMVARSGEATSEALRFVEYKRVLPGRYTKTNWSDTAVGGSHYTLATTAFNPTRGERPVTCVVGKNECGARSLAVDRGGTEPVFRAAIGRYFAVLLPSEAWPTYSDSAVSFQDASGRDLTKLFKVD